jgi:predicted esterase
LNLEPLVPVRSLSIPTPIHGRVLVEDAAGSFLGRLLVFHGYAQSADDALREVRQIPGAADWQVVAVQGLHRFYTRTDQQVVASWMTRQDRELAIVDNIQYVDRVLDHLEMESASRTPPVISKPVFVGFSQGVAMAYRAAVRGRHGAAGIVALAGDIPPELKTEAQRAAGSPGARQTTRWPPVLIGVGTNERWYVPDEVEADVAFLRAADVTHEVIRFEGGHEWTDEFREHVSLWLRGRGGDH